MGSLTIAKTIEGTGEDVVNGNQSKWIWILSQQGLRRGFNYFQVSHMF